MAGLVDYSSRREEEIEEPIFADHPAEDPRHQVREDDQGHKAGNQYDQLLQYLHRSIVEG